jgi:hypothetical protein
MSHGNDPIFRTNDGSNCAGVGGTTIHEKLKAYSQLLSKGLIRVGISVPPGADFTLVDVDDPYSCANPSGEISLYRRPLPATNLKFISAVMWDGRESSATTTIRQDLLNQARDATLGHAASAIPPTEAQANAIVDFELGLFTAQIMDLKVGPLGRAGGAKGGPLELSKKPFFIGINDPIANGGADFSTNVFSMFKPWLKLDRGYDRYLASIGSVDRARASIARGEEIFNKKPIHISGVRGLNDVLNAPTINGSCTLCHDTPSAGSHSVKLPIDIGLADASRRTPDMPLYTFRCDSGEVIQTMDPGRALITGKCSDMNKMKGPVLRALASRPPYFHDGSAATLADVIRFYDKRFHIGFTSEEKHDLAAFLGSL